MREVAAARSATQVRKLPPLFFLGSLMILFGLGTYFFGIAFSMFRLLFQLGEPFRSWNEAIVWYSGLPTTIGVCLAGLDLALLLPAKRRESRRRVLAPVMDKRVVVALTAYNDEESIGPAVADFARHPLVKRVIVVDNNSMDQTATVAAEAGARVVVEQEPGYGKCVYRCFKEALSEDGELIVLCEGDMTFRAADIEKLTAYIEHADVVNGTCIVEQLRDYST